jgi:YYY domain-containing protein
MLFTMNSWDFPTYLLVVCACIGVQAYISDDSFGWWRIPALTIVGLAVVSLFLYAPFFIHFQSLTKGVGLVTTPSDVWQFVQVFGLPLLPALLLVGCLAVLLQPTSSVEEIEDEYPSREAGAARLGSPGHVFALLALLVVVVIGARFHLWVMLLMLALGAAAVLVLHRVTNTEEPNRADALALLLVAIGCLMLALPEVVYVRDSFDGSSVYRMNTVFKFYYQAWVLLGVAAAYAVYRGWHVLRQYFSPSSAWAAVVVVAAGALGGLYYTVNAPQSANQGGLADSLNGASVLQANAPGDYTAVRWLRTHVSGNPVELEATGGEYDTRFARVSTFTGLPTVLGWGGHEYQWRGSDPEIQQRSNDIKTIYTTTNVQTAQTLLRRYNVRYVIVGATERFAYPGQGLNKFGRFMHPVMTDAGTTLYAW